MKGSVGVTAAVVSLAQFLFHEYLASHHAFAEWSDGTHAEEYLRHSDARRASLETLQRSIQNIARAFVAVFPVVGNLVLAGYDYRSQLWNYTLGHFDRHYQRAYA